MVATFIELDGQNVNIRMCIFLLKDGKYIIIALLGKSNGIESSLLVKCIYKLEKYHDSNNLWWTKLCKKPSAVNEHTPQ